MSRYSLGLALVLLLSSMMPAAPPVNVVVIVNEANPVTELTASQVRLTYLRKLSRRWKDFNKNILPADRAGIPDTKRVFLDEVLKMSPGDFDRFFSEREYQNQESQPAKFNTDDEVVRYVAENPGAIGYVSSAPDLESRKVKVIFRMSH